MRKRQYIIYIVICNLILLVGFEKANSQIKTRFNFSGYATSYSSEIMPLWLYSNNWGMHRYDDKNLGILTYVNGQVQLLDKDSHKLEVGGGLFAHNQTQAVVLHELYLKGSVYFFDFSVGKEAYSPIAIDDDLTSGMYLGSSNSRPIPKITLGIFDYTNVPFTNGLLQVKGALSQGWLNDDRGKYGNSDVLLHEKFAYLRVGKKMFKPYAGLMHSALFGGIKPDGTEIAVDYWPTFFGQGSSKVGGGEETNVAGAHMGLFDFGIDFKKDEMTGRFYLQKPFADRSGMNIQEEFLKDRIIGGVLKWERKQLVNGVSFEYAKTDYQSGPGTPDPIDPINNTLVFVYKLDDVEGYMKGRFPEVDATGWSNEDLAEFLRNEWNYGYDFGGRDDYMNNYLYYGGWTYGGMSMGTPLINTVSQLSLTNPDITYTGKRFIINNRIRAFHLGIQGSVGAFNYRIKQTLSFNKGAYGEEYLSRYRWEKTPNYFFEQEKIQSYSFLEVDRSFMDHKLDVALKIGADFGEIYNSFGAQIGATYHLDY
ncbi:MAG: hypothetical protein JW717_05385 [Marinilabiliaceae bacterium]|nr:hypothetical protein [Marinilabiliaceae bacterium]